MSDDQRMKKDAGKASRPELLDAEALTEIAKVLKFGADKYADNLWREGIAYSRVYGALLRHLFTWFTGDNIDEETGLHHLAHAGCCLMFLLSYELESARVEELDRAVILEGLDDRV